MLSALFAAAIVAPADLPATWYGPVIATFNVEFDGNPFDPEQNDLHVKFLGPKGEAIDRIAYYDGHGAWKAVLVTPSAGKFQPTLYRNGHKVSEPDVEGVLDATTPMKEGYLQVNPESHNRFRRDTGQPFWPIGFNLGWQNADFLPMKDELGKMGKAGITWTRIWANHWDNKNPWWPMGDENALPGQLWPVALDKWEGLEKTCDENGINFQMVLFHHGAFSSTVNPNWPDHPWNAKNKGFLKDAADFFTDAEAKRRTKMWLRYAVARYGASPHLMAWELFNEVEWVDARYAGRWADIVAWHKEMAEYLRSIDPYHHMVTTSSAMDQPALWAAMDYMQPHTYPSNILAAVYGAVLPADKPGFFGEFGPGGPSSDNAQVVRDGIYGAMLANQAGAAMYWYWDAVEKENLYPLFATAAKVAEVSDFARHPQARRVDLHVETAGHADLTLAPGGGWEPTRRTRLVLPNEAGPKEQAEISSYLQGTSHRDMFPEPLTITFDAKQPGTFKLSTAGYSKTGAALKISVNGKKAVEKAYPGQQEEGKPESFEASFPDGHVTITVANDGADWVRLGSMSITGIGPQVSAMALGESDWLLARFTLAPGVKGPISANVSGFPLADGEYEVTTFDAISGNTATNTMRVKDFRLPGWVVGSGDQIVTLKRRS